MDSTRAVWEVKVKGLGVRLDIAVGVRGGREKRQDSQVPGQVFERRNIKREHIETSKRCQVFSFIPFWCQSGGVAQRYRFGSHLRGGENDACVVAEIAPGERVERIGKRVQINLKHLSFQQNYRIFCDCAVATEIDLERGSLVLQCKSQTSVYKEGYIAQWIKHHSLDGSPVTGAPIPAV